MCHNDPNHPSNLTLVSQPLLLAVKVAAQKLASTIAQGPRGAYPSAMFMAAKELLAALGRLDSDLTMDDSHESTKA